MTCHIRAKVIFPTVAVVEVADYQCVDVLCNALPHRRTAVMMRVSTSYAAIPDAKKFYVLSNLVKARRTAARGSWIVFSRLEPGRAPSGT